VQRLLDEFIDVLPEALVPYYPDVPDQPQLLLRQRPVHLHMAIYFLYVTGQMSFADARADARADAAGDAA
jgi:hypothetical protein